MSKEQARSFSREFKLRAVQRMEAGENVSALARELTVAAILGGHRNSKFYKTFGSLRDPLAAMASPRG